MRLLLRLFLTNDFLIDKKNTAQVQDTMPLAQLNTERLLAAKENRLIHLKCKYTWLKARGISAKHNPIRLYFCPKR